jgi:hypothetical protein
MISWNFRHTHLQEVGLTHIPEDHDFFKIFFSSMLNFKTITWQIPEQIPRETNTTKYFSHIDRVWDILYQTKPSPLFPPTKYAMVPQYGPFSLHTMLEGPWLHRMAFPTPWYSLWMRVKGPHHYKVTALGSCVKWPLSVSPLYWLFYKSSLIADSTEAQACVT